MVSQEDFPESWSTDCENKGVKVEVRIQTDNAEEDISDDVNVAASLLSTGQVRIIVFSPEVLNEVTVNGFTSAQAAARGEEPDQTFSDFQRTGQDDEFLEYTGTFSAEGLNHFEIESAITPRIGTTWIEIPTTEVEEWVTRDGVSDIERTAKVQFPIAWDGEDVLQLINAFSIDGTDGFSFVRIWFRDERNDKWVINHFGYVGTVGRGDTMGEAVMWVYDMAKLLGGVEASFTFEDPQVRTVLNAVSKRMNEATPVTIVNPTVIGPDVEDSFQNEIIAGAENLEPIPSDGEITFPKTSMDTANYEDEITKTIGEEFETKTIETGVGITNFTFGSKSFHRNRDTLLDVINWLAEKADASWHFEPTPNGATLVLDYQYNPRWFVQNDVDQRQEVDGKPLFRFIDVIDNTALYDINPINALTVNGSAARGFIKDSFDAIDDFLGTKFIASKRFPKVTVRSESLFSRAQIQAGSSENAEMKPPVIDVDTDTLEDTKKAAKRELKQRVGAQSAGNILMYGMPYILPFDQVAAIPTCNDLIPEADIPVVLYEVYEVKHMKKSGSQFQTEVRVSVTVTEQDIKVTEANMIDLETGEVV